MSELYKRIEQLCNEKQISITQMCKESGASRGSLGDLANNRIQTLSSNTIQKIANFFNVSLDWLTGKTRYRSNQEYKEYNWGVSDPNFEAAFDFASLLAPMRKEQDVSLFEFGGVIGATEGQMQEIEEGLLPITYEQAEKLCKYLGTDVSQVLFDNELYDEEVPEKYHNNVKEWERKKEELDKEAEFESANMWREKSNTGKATPFLTEKEQQLLAAYSAHPELQFAVDKLLGINDEDTETVKIVARSEDDAPMTTEKVPKSKVKAALEDKSIQSDEDL